jgi:hypothetical protein
MCVQYDSAHHKGTELKNINEHTRHTHLNLKNCFTRPSGLAP